MPDIQVHLDAHVKEWPHSFAFTTEGGKTIWRGNFNKIVKWRKIVAEVGRPGLHFHDLRHAGNTLAAQTGDQPAGPHGAHGPRHPPSRPDLPTRHLRC